MKLNITLYYSGIPFCRDRRLSGKESPANVGDAGDLGSSPSLGRSPRGGIGNPLQYSFLGNPKDKGAWMATVHGVVQSQKRLYSVRKDSVSECARM